MWLQGWVEWITYLPGLLCIAGNVFFFLNIFFILLTKLRAPHANEPTNFRKAVRACSVLIPLFGLQWLVTFYRCRKVMGFRPLKKFIVCPCPPTDHFFVDVLRIMAQ